MTKLNRTQTNKNMKHAKHNTNQT